MNAAGAISIRHTSEICRKLTCTNKFTGGLHGSSGRQEGKWVSEHELLVCGTSVVPLLPVLPQTSPPKSPPVIHHPTDHCYSKCKIQTRKKQCSLAHTPQDKLHSVV